MVEKRKRRHLAPRGDPAAKAPPAAKPDPRLITKEDFGENTFAGALEAVKGVLEKAAADDAAKNRKKG
ncbi:MAG: hypothetical protein IPJ65_11910 [Archangiaceae bacterium]|nr:hypothetical protein [Archangiaceae bacterium]